MRKDIVLPFRTLSADKSAIKPEQWFTFSRDRTDRSLLDRTQGIKGWSYDMPLYVGREISIDPMAVRKTIALGDTHAPFELLVTLDTSVIGNRRILKKIQIQGDDVHTTEIELKLESRALCQHISLVTSLVLAKDVENAPAWAPDRKGSRLWEDETTVSIEGDNSRFPMRDIDFSEHHQLPPDADWHLDWQPTLTHYSFNSAVTLLLNSAKPDFLERLQEQDEILTRTLMGDIVCEITTYLLQQEHFIDPDESFPKGSLGQVVKSWLEHAFPGDSCTEIRERYTHSPNLVSTKLRGITAQI